MLSKPASRKSVERGPDVTRLGRCARARRAAASVKLCAPSDTRVTPPSRSRAASSGVTVSGFASTVISRDGGSASSRRASAAGSSNVGVPPPRKTVSTVACEHAAFELELAEQRVDVAVVLSVAADDRDEVAVAAPMPAERQVHVEVADAHRTVSPRLRTARKASCGNLDGADLLHALLAGLLLLEQLALARDVAAVALREHVLAARLDRLARDDPCADRGLDRRRRTSGAGSPRAAARRGPCRGRRRSPCARRARARRPTRRRRGRPRGRARPRESRRGRSRSSHSRASAT